VLVGFPQDEGVRRNGGRPGAAAAPAAIRRWLQRLTPWDGSTGADLAALRVLDLGDVDTITDLEASQQALGEVTGALLRAGAVPLVLGGGHETAFGHYLGHIHAGQPVGIINLDAHLDVRPYPGGRGHSGSPFRQALEHPTHPLPGERYVCLGAQPGSVSRDHAAYVRDRGGTIHWCNEVRGQLAAHLARASVRLQTAGCRIHLSLDCDVVRAADVPGVSAPNALGLDGVEVAGCLRQAGADAAVVGLDVVEINPSFDVDGRSARWAAVALWHFLAGLAQRREGTTETQRRRQSK
jgi:formiminoglutamase